MERDLNRSEAERLLGVAEKLLHSRDLNGSRDFAVLAKETDPSLESVDQLLSIVEVLLAADKRVNKNHDWYAILRIDHRTDNRELIKKNYHRYALLLHPDKNKYPFADQAFNLVAGAWAVLSDDTKKSIFDRQFSLFTRVELSGSGNKSNQPTKIPVRRGQQEEEQARRTPQARRADVGNNSKSSSRGDQRSRLSTFWTACPYCYRLFEYHKAYEGCCLRCQNCQRAFHAVVIPNLPPLVPGKDAYYCCWAFFPLGFSSGNSEAGAKAAAPEFPNWMPPMFSAAGQQQGNKNGGAPTPVPAATPTTANVAGNRNNVADISDGSGRSSAPPLRKRGRPRKDSLRV